MITGISTPLFEQSTARLVRDLQILTRPDRKWKHFTNPSIRGTARTAIQDALEEWADPTVPETERQTVLITVMKNVTHLRNLNSVLSQLGLAGVPTLVIDDEADQAGLNTMVNQQSQSTTYRHLLALKQHLPHHSFLQYTATPQAPLLINLIDLLSPSYAELVTPGPDYVGGKDFFIDHPGLIRIIPNNEIPARGNTLTAPPESLLLAMRIFFLGVAAGIVGDGGIGNRSMLVHPSQETLRHAEYFRWVRDAKTHWQSALGLPPNDPDRADAVADFEQAYRDLRATEVNLPPFDSLLARLPHALRRTREEEVNAARGRTPTISWYDTYGHILVGGQAMDRGFTVEGLTVTYMPRLVGVGNADTVQQRARFFGYKRRYLGLCRVFLETDAAAAYRRYVTHEEDIRAQLAAHRGRPLSEWKREFLLTQTLKPTRDSVLDLPYMRVNFGGWFSPKTPHDTTVITAANRVTVAAFINTADLSSDDGDSRRTKMQRHRVRFGMPLGVVYEQLLTRYRLTRPSESARYTSLLLQLQRYREENPDARCTVYDMNRGVDQTLTRDRPVDGADALTSYLFQGAHPAGRGSRTTIYPGDRNLPSRDPIQVQIHHLRLERNGQVVEDDVPTLAILVPPMPDDLVIQSQGGR
ncbi:MAG: Z1 domain-containing protein [Gemmatimonadaceae bacterium]